MRRGAALAILASLSLGTARLPAFAQGGPRTEGPIIDGIAVGAHVAVAIRNLGMPADVTSLDTGHTWTWRTADAELHAITDDGAIVRAVDDRPLDNAEAIVVSVDGKPVRIALRGYTIAQADADLNSVAGLSSRTARLFDLGRGRVLVFLFDDAGALTRAVYGDRGFVSRLGLMTADAEMVKSLRYVAPRLRAAPTPPPGASHETIVRYVLDKDGRVDSVAIEVGSKDAAFDERALELARKAAWAPAKINNVPVRSVAFRIVTT
ncbi:MAG: TonB family protein [Candidatus Eremiobacteraeota bacterium]|nr:TonB family protein [Candidatus Eremiobacteraeota bacterium]